MKLRAQLNSFTISLLTITVVCISSVGIYLYREKAFSQIENFRQDEINRAKNRLRSTLSVALTFLEKALENTDGSKDSLVPAFDQLRAMRYDQGDGYFWIINDKMPFPDIVFQATQPEVEGQSTNHPKFQLNLDRPGENFHAEIVKKCVEKGETFTEYSFERPDVDRKFKKMAYSYYWKQQGWVISTGIYIDTIEAQVTLKRAQVEKEMSQVIGTILLSSALILVLSLGIVGRYAKVLLRLIESIKNNISALSEGRIEKRIVIRRKDELGEVAHLLNTLADTLERYASFATEIGNGQIHAQFRRTSEKDVLGNALLNMQANLSNSLSEVQSVISTVADHGDLSEKLDTSGKKGAWQDLNNLINRLVNTVSQPIENINTIVHAMAKGDLSRRFDDTTNGDFKRMADNLNLALDSLNHALSGIMKNAGRVAVSSKEMMLASKEMDTTTEEIATAIGDMSLGAQNQVAQVDESSTLVEAILKSSTEMESQASTINQAAQMGAERSEHGLNQIQKVGASMSQISEIARDTNQGFQRLFDRSREISRVLKIISDIAAQTNLLSLNAAIEAAQAGEAGRGFAVVAEEIRKLAEDSRQSAKAIEKLVADVEQDARDAANVLEIMNKNIQGGERAAQDASNAFSEIAVASDQTLALSERILTLSTSQKTDIREVVNKTETVIVIAEQTAAGTEEIATSASELSAGMSGYRFKSEEFSEIAKDLNQAVRQFVLVGSPDEEKPQTRKEEPVTT